ncbi:MAG: inositol monophosphatase [Holosporales bacterium]|jgi:myo-inositol-1(or 4)-monophosphatase|nr:inositol monophosphatase [Holosporales bacterium]
MAKAAEKAASRLVRDFGELEKLQVSRKGLSDFVTSADRNTESKIMYELSKARPGYSFLCEESGVTENENKSSVWIVDPIAGTNNFMRGIPFFAINIALQENSKVVAGITYDPMRRECFKAEVGSGAYLGNHCRLRVSGREKISEAVVAVRANYDVDVALSKCGMMSRRTGSVALDLAYLAAGKYDAVVVTGAPVWDVASGEILIRESGGFWDVQQVGDNIYDVVAASSTRLLNAVKECL